MKILSIIIVLFLTGCASSQAIGSRYWHDIRTTEIDTALANAEISKAEYLSLKNETDQIRRSFLEEGRYNHGYLSDYCPRHHRYSCTH